MFGLEILEVAIGLGFTYFAVSTMCSGFVEIIIKFTKLRSRHLKTSLGKLLDDPNYNGFVKSLYEHHLIASPFKDKLGEPTYMAAKDFSGAVFDILGGFGESALYRALSNRIEVMENGDAKTRLMGMLQASPSRISGMRQDLNHVFRDKSFNLMLCELFCAFPPKSTPFESIRDRILEVESKGVQKKLNSILESKPEELKSKASEIEGWFEDPAFQTGFFDVMSFGSQEFARYKAIEQRIMTIKDKHVRTRMLAILHSSSNRLQDMRVKVENWFDTSMESVSEWYRRKMRIFVTFTSIFFVTAINCDTIYLTKMFWNDNELRQATIAAAEGYVVKYEQRQSEKAADSTQSFTNLLVDLKEDIGVAKKLPVGWGAEIKPWEAGWDEKQDKTLWWMTKIFGLLMTIGAVSLGSTYWYRQLKSLLNLHFKLSGRKQRSTEEENSSSKEGTQPTD